MSEGAEIRSEIERARWTVRGPRRRYSETLVGRAVEYARSRLSRGARRSEIARELGLDVATLDRWVSRPAPEGARFRRVELSAALANPKAERSLAMVRLPSGVGIEGLGLQEAVGVALLLDRQLR